MKSKNVLIETDKLKIGLFISALDRPWSDSALFNHGFWIEDETQIQHLQELCHSVFVDVGRSQAKFMLKKSVIPNLELVDDEQFHLSKTDQYQKNQQNQQNQQKLKPSSTRQKYQPTMSREREMTNALAVYNQLTLSLDQALADTTGGVTTNLTELKTLSSQLVTSIYNNSDAINFISRMGAPFISVHNSAIRVAIWSVLFGINLGKNRTILEGLALAGLLCKVGYAKSTPEAEISDDFINNNDVNRPFSQDSQKGLNRNINKSLAILKSQEAMDSLVTLSLTNHLERLDGSGYPGKLKGKRVSVSAQIIGISEYYERLVSPELTQKALSPAKAIRSMQSLRDTKFAAKVVDQFIHILGLYPTGSLVLLNTNEIAIVQEQKPKQKLSPTIIIISNTLGEPTLDQLRLDLAATTEYSITRSLSADSIHYHLNSQGLNSSQFNQNDLNKPWWRKLRPKK
ncbi:MAG: DUF3391 domain-containing protein [Pseudomonadales bacterium]|nr:DUF3391 domain-containing protein [Pseudomonadales bacterium]